MAEVFLFGDSITWGLYRSKSGYSTLFPGIRAEHTPTIVPYSSTKRLRHSVETISYSFWISGIHGARSSGRSSGTMVSTQTARVITGYTSR